MRSAWLGRVPYDTALALQEQLVYGKISNARHGLGELEDTLLLLEHDPVYTYHQEHDFETCLRDRKDAFWKFVREKHIAVTRTSRGGKMTYHGPGQLIGYCIKRLNGPFARDFVEKLAHAIIATLAEYGVASRYRDGGVWVGAQKICSFGVRFVGGSITMHGFSLNVSTEPLQYLQRIYPCGAEQPSVISLNDLGVDRPLEKVADDVSRNIGIAFGDTMKAVSPREFGFYPTGKPAWIRTPASPSTAETRQLVKGAALHTVCEEAKCPNLNECWSRGDVTIMILGDTCTRSCGFCAVKTGRPSAIDWGEPERTACAVAHISHSHIVITSVDRDELPDNGCRIWKSTIIEVKKRSPDKTIEVLTPDFKGNDAHINFVLDAGPHVFAHNIETIARLHRKVRPQAKYERSLAVLALAKKHHRSPIVKSNIMLGFGESEGEVVDTIHDLCAVGVDILTITQYLQPTPKHLPVVKYYAPAEFEMLKKKAEAMGIPVVVAGSLVRTSYRAGEAYALARERLKEGFSEPIRTYRTS